MGAYFGSKATSGLYQAIIALMPPHNTYIETHLGGGAIMKRKPPAEKSIGIDLDSTALSKFTCHYQVELIHKDAHEQIAKAGAEVLIASRSALDKEAEIKSLPGLENATLFSVDITSEEQIQDMLRDLGKIDHLVFTIKAPLITGEFVELDNVDVRHAFETKFWGQYNFTKLAKASINDGGSIIFTSGTLALKPYQGYSTMGVIAGAVDSLCKSLAVELAPLRVNAVSPGYKSLEELEETIPLGLGCSEKMANPYLFLMNDSYTTGTSLVCDGGAILV